MPLSYTIHDVAARSGVSEATVSRVLNEHPAVRPQTRDRVLTAVRELKFVPNAIAKGLRMKRTGIVGVIVPDISSLFFLDIIKGLENTFDLNDYRVAICDSQNQLKKERDNTRWLVDGSVDGLILLRPMMDDQTLRELADLGYPIGVFGRIVDHPVVTSVAIENRVAGRRVAEHLIGHGHKRIGIVLGTEGVQDSEERFQGFQDALRQHGLELVPELVERGGFTEEGGARAFQAMLDRHSVPTAVFAANDEMAVGVMQVAQAAGIRVPEDLAVVGFDNIRLARVVTPALTTLNQPKLDAGFRLGQNMLNRLGGTADSEQIVLPGDLLVRRSCGC